MDFSKPTKILIKGQESPDTVSDANDFGLLIRFYMGDDAYEYYKELLNDNNNEIKIGSAN